MRILQLCPLWFPISQNAPGGIETFLAQLTKGLMGLDCEITLIASGDSQTDGKLLPVVSRNLYAQMKEGTAHEYVYYEQHQLRIALQHASRFDLVHSHIGPGAFLLSGLTGWIDRMLHTVHSPVYEDLQWFVSQNPGIWLSTVSEFQASELREYGAANCHVVHNGIDTESFVFNPKGGEGLLFLGRIESEKGPDIAVKVAQTLDCPLVLAGPIVKHGFFNESIEPFLNKKIRYVGVVDHKNKIDLLGAAGCVVMPSRWAEPFGMVAIESMACGTPVVALARGALPEIIEPGLTGYLAQEEQEVAALVTQALKLNRAAIRTQVSARFDIAIMAEEYRRLYEDIVAISR